MTCNSNACTASWLLTAMSAEYFLFGTDVLVDLQSRVMAALGNNYDCTGILLSILRVLFAVKKRRRGGREEKLNRYAVNFSFNL